MMKKHWPYILIILITFLTFFKIFIKDEYPYPGDLLVSFNFPWYSGGWEGYDPWTTHKEFIAMDAIRQHLPWHKLTFTEIKMNFSLPLWNPYTFSGSPQLPNIQTFIFNPLNIFFLLLPMFEAWIIFIVLQVPLTIFFTYLFTRSLGLSKWPSLMSGIAFAFSSYLINWIEIGIVGYSILWLPLILYSIQKVIETLKTRFLILLILSSAAAIFAGHIQTTVFIFAVSVSYYFAKHAFTKKRNNQKSAGIFIVWFLLTFMITAIQTIPALEFYLNSPLVEPLAKHVFSINSMPLKNLIALFAPDFFGNPATNNFWSVMYGDATPHIGVLPLFFAVFAIISAKRWEVKFFAGMAIIILLYTTRSPLFLLIDRINIPLLTGTTAARSMFVFCFALSILSGIGLEGVIRAKNGNKAFYGLIVVFLLIYSLFIIFTFLYPNFSGSEDAAKNMTVTKRNLILPTLTFISLPASLLAVKIFSKFNLAVFKSSWLIIIFATTIFGGIYQFNKGQPSSPKQFFFPNHPIFNWLQNNASINRFHGDLTAKTWNNIPAYFNLYSAEGYGVFRVKRYAELFAAQETGNVPEYYERSTAEFSEKQQNYKKRLYNLTGVKYFLAKDDSNYETTISDHNAPQDDVKLIWQEDKFKIYERQAVLPRFFLTNDYVVSSNRDQIIDKIYDGNFNLRTLLLEEEPDLIVMPDSGFGEARLALYTPNKISFDISTSTNSLFFISDTYYPGWKAYVDSKEIKIYRAHYTFRAVAIPAGTRKLEFKYEPASFKIGYTLTAIGAISTALLAYIAGKRRYL